MRETRHFAGSSRRGRGASGRGPAWLRAAVGPATLLACLGACDAFLGIDEVELLPLDDGPTGGGEAGAGPSGGGGRAPAAGQGPSNAGRGGGRGGAGGEPGAAGRGGAPGGGGAAGDGGGASGGGGGGGAGCTNQDKLEPNDQASQAKPLANVTTCDAAKSVLLTMDGTEDWFSFSGTKDLLGLCSAIEARAFVQSIAPLRVCYYLSPAQAVSCPVGTEFGDDEVPPGYAGCCASNATSVTFGANGGQALLRVSPASPGAACFQYTLTYRY